MNKKFDFFEEIPPSGCPLHESEEDVATIFIDGGCYFNQVAEKREAYYSFNINYGQYKGEKLPLGNLTSNEAEYQALIEAMRFALTTGGFRKARFYTDSALVANQVMGRWKIESQNLKLLWVIVCKLREYFEKFEICKVSRDEIEKILGH